MSYTVKHFEDTDAGAPTLDRTQPGSLITVLKQCLIDGYNLQPFDSLEMSGDYGKANFPGNHGFRVHQIVEIGGAVASQWNGNHRVTAVGTQWIEFEVEGQPAPESGAGLEIKAAPAGGWEMPFISVEGDRAAFRSTDPESTQTFWYLDDRRSADIEDSPHTTTYVDWRFMRGVEDMIDIDTRTNDFGDGYVFVGTSSRGNIIPYDIIADSRMVYLITHPINSAGEHRSVHAFGDFVPSKPGDPYAAMLVLGRYSTNSTASGTNGTRWGYLASSANKRLRRSWNGASVDPSFSVHGHQASNHIGQGYSFPNPTDLALMVYRPLLVSQGGAMRGIVPGVAQPLNTTPFPPRGVVDIGGRLYKAITHASDYTLTDPSAGQTLFDLEGPWFGPEVHL